MKTIIEIRDSAENGVEIRIDCDALDDTLQGDIRPSDFTPAQMLTNAALETITRLMAEKRVGTIMAGRR